MESSALHLEVRNALELSDELSRHEHGLGRSADAGHLRSLESALASIERELGRSHGTAGGAGEAVEASLSSDPDLVSVVRRSIAVINARRDHAPLYLHARYDALVASARRVVFGLDHPGERPPSKPLLGLPLARVLSQDAHSVLDYLASAACAASAVLARTSAARVTGGVLAAAGMGTAATTDARLSFARVMPIETHEAIDYAWGLGAILAPFALGYAKKDKVATAIQVAAGGVMLLASLFTDYRAEKGITTPRRSRGGPEAGPSRIQTTAMRVPEIERPLEGLSSAPTDWTSDSSPDSVS